MTQPSASRPDPHLVPTARAQPGAVDWVLWLGFASVAAVYVRALWFTPAELRQGLAQKIFYVHAPAAWVAFLAFALVAVAGLLYLWLRDVRLDRFAESSAEVGVVFTTVVLVTGPLWGRPVWGTWWTWDARLTSTLFLWFIYVGYLVLRGAIESPALRARYSAVVGALGALLIPFIHLSVYLFRTLHPQPIILKPDRPSLPSEMLTTLLVAMLAFTVLYVGLVRARYALSLAREAAEERGVH